LKISLNHQFNVENVKDLVTLKKTCNKEYKCGKCGENHMENTCQKDKENAKCANCKQNHSVFYRGCKEYKEAKNLKLTLNKAKSTSPSQTTNHKHTINSSDYTRNYSSFVNIDQNNNKLLKDIGNLISANSANIIQSTKELVEKESNEIVKSIDNILKKNNMKLCYFVVDAIKSLVPSVSFSKSKMEYISAAFSHHELGNVQAEHLNKYFLKNDKETKSANSNYYVNDSNEEYKANNYTPYKP
jgi:hypothetical protein